MSNLDVREKFMPQANREASPDKSVIPLSVQDLTAHIKQLLFSGRAPELPDALAAVPDFRDIHFYILELREHLAGCAKGDFSADIRIRGALAGMVKALQANMLHLIWQMEQVGSGDLTHRIDFMGDFANAFNGMVRQLGDALTALHHKELELTTITGELQQEVEKRGMALSALKKSEENFKYLAEHDPLTCLLNRRSFFARAVVELARNTILDQYTAFAVMDIDHFKKFNDTYGHLNGDEVLRHIAAVGVETLRDNDIMGRMGGEEFVFLLSKTNEEHGLLAAERIRKAIASRLVEIQGKEVQVTASFGVVAIPPGSNAGKCDGLLEHALGLADKALYEAKAGGRNRVCLAGFESTRLLA